MQNKKKWQSSTLIIVFSIFISVILFLTIFSTIAISLGDKIEQEQQEKFDENVEKIKKIIKNSEDKNELKNYIMMGYRIVISDKLNNVVVFNSEGQLLEKNKATNQQIKVIVEGYADQFEWNNQMIHISYPMKMKAPKVTNIVLGTLPLLVFLSTGIVMCIIAIYLYFYGKEKKKLVGLFKLMDDREISTVINDKNFDIRIQEYYDIEQQVKELYTSLEQSQQKIQSEMSVIKSLEQANLALLQGITHEMKTPLMSTKLLLDQLSIDESNETIIRQVNQQITNLENLIKEVLFVTQRKHLSIQDKYVPVSLALNQVIDNYQVLLDDKQLKIEKTIESEFYFNLDEKMLEKILSNLLSNAIHYTKKHSIIKIYILDHRLIISNEVVDGNCIDWDRIGEPFMGFGVQRGTGLGIYIIKTILINTPYDFEIYNELTNQFTAEIRIKSSE